jgi:serine/threonine protein kinase
MIYRVLADSLRLLHDKGIVHSDLKPSNVLLKSTRNGMFTTKLIDFDSSYLVSEPPSNSKLEGDQTYLSPEACLAMNDSGPSPSQKSDVFSFGLMLHAFETGKMPDFSEKYNYPHEALLDHTNLYTSNSIQPDLRTLIERMLETDASKRPSMQEVFAELGRLGNRTISASPLWYKPNL